MIILEAQFAFAGLKELTLSANPRISAQGWARLAMALANCTTLRMLFVDYNPLDDYAASCLLVAVAASQNLEILDLEGCGLSEHTAQVVISRVSQNSCMRFLFSCCW